MHQSRCRAKRSAGSQPAAPIFSFPRSSGLRSGETVVDSRCCGGVGHVNFNVSVGTHVPRHIHFAALPQTLVSIQPELLDRHSLYEDETVAIRQPTRSCRSWLSSRSNIDQKAEGGPRSPSLSRAVARMTRTGLVTVTETMTFGTQKVIELKCKIMRKRWTRGKTHISPYGPPP